MAKHKIAVIPGDGIGKEVVPEGLRVLDAAARKYKVELQLDHLDWSCDYYLQHGPCAMWSQSLLDSYDQFKLAGYWTLLVGMKVPYQTQYDPAPEHLALFDNKRAYFHQRALKALTVRQALDIVHGPNWRWA